MLPRTACFVDHFQEQNLFIHGFRMQIITGKKQHNMSTAFSKLSKQ
jgi:hypothetical protein